MQQVLMYQNLLKVLICQLLLFPTTTDNSFFPSIKWYRNSNFYLVFKGSWLKQKKSIYAPSNRVNLFTVYVLDSWPRDLDPDFILKSCWFGGVKLAKNANPDKYL